MDNECRGLIHRAHLILYIIPMEMGIYISHEKGAKQPKQSLLINVGQASRLLLSNKIKNKYKGF